MLISPRRISIGIRILRGSFENGFRAELVVWQGSTFSFAQGNLELPADPGIFSDYEAWKTAYRALGQMRAPIVIPEHITSDSQENQAVITCRELGQALRNRLRRWFNDARFKLIESAIQEIKRRRNITDDEPLPIFFEILDVRDQDKSTLHALPWHLWELFESDQFEAVLFSPERRIRVPRHGRIIRLQFPSVLTIFGSNDGGLRLDDDRRTWRKIKKDCSKIVSIPTPIDAEPQSNDPPVNADAVVRELRDSNCKILFFAGHSASNPTFTDGVLEISHTERVSVDNLRQSLNRAVNNGLILAIFNSCDGLGIARFLSERGVPYIVVMRERISDDAARKFLVHFLEEFSKGYPVYLAVKRARECLEGMPHFASWFPVIWQHPSNPDLIWSNSIWAKFANLFQDNGYRFNRWLRTIFNQSQDRTDNTRKNKFLLPLLALAAFLTALLLHQPILKLASPVIPNISRFFPQESSISIGDQALFGYKETDANRAFKRAIEQYNTPTFEPEITDAIQGFETLFQTQENRQNPLLRIYYNNAIVERAISKGSAEKLVIAVSANKDAPEQTLLGVALAQTMFNCTRLLENNIQNIQSDSTQCTGTNGRFLEVVVAEYTDESFDRVIDKLVDYSTPDAKKIIGVVGRYPSANIERAAQGFGRKAILIAPTSNAVRGDSSNQKNKISLDQEYVFRIVPDVNFTADQVKTRLGLDTKTGIFYAYPEQESIEKAVFSASLKSAIEAKINPWNVEADLEKPLNCNLLSKSMMIEECISSVKRQNLEVLFLVPELNHLENALAVIEVVQKQNIPLRLIGADTLYDNQVIETIRNLNGLNSMDLEIMTPWARSSDGTVVANRSYVEQSGVYIFGTSQFNWRTAASYDSTLVLVQGMLNVLERNQPLSAETLSQELSSETFKVVEKLGEIETATGPIEFQNGDRKTTDEYGRIRTDLQRFVKVVCKSPSECGFQSD